MDTLRQDLRAALRSLAKSPGFTAIAATCIALGIATNVFVWAPVNTLLLRPMPFRDPDAVMQLSSYQTTGRRESYGSWSYPDYADASSELRDVFSAMGAYSGRSVNVGGRGEPERLNGMNVSASLFPMLGIETARGRFFRPDEELDARVVVIGYGVWQRKFGGDPTIVGKTIPLDGIPHEVVGVMARGVRFPEQADIWLPLHPGEARNHREWRFYLVSGRLAPGVTVAQADARVVAFMRGLEERHRDTNLHESAWVLPMNELVAREVRPIFLLMLGAVGFVLLIACANVANLLLARGSVRQREVAVRLAMGASRLRIVRLLMTESLLLAAIGGVLGIVLGTWLVELFIVRFMPTTIPYWMNFEVDRFVVVVTLATTAVTALVFGALPALHLSAPSLTETLKESGARGASAGSRAGRLRSSLVVAELALSLTLLMGAGLMMRSFFATMRARLGYDTAKVLTFELAMTGPRYEGDSARAAFVRTLEERLAAIPGVQSIGATTQLPIGNCCYTDAYFPEEKEYPFSGGPQAWHARATPSFLSAMQIAVTAGRPFDERDLAPGAEPVVIVDSVLAAREWPGVDPIGKRLRVGDPNASTSPLRTVVGVVPHLVARQVTETVGPQLFVPLRPAEGATRTYALRAAGDPSALIPAARAAVRALDPDLPLSAVATMRFVIEDRMFQPRVYGTMFALFATMALLLATIGLYGVMSFLVSQRTRELGVRMALGADRRAVLRLVLGNAARLFGTGLLIGIPAAIGTAQLLRGLLYGVAATDPLTIGGVTALLAIVSLIASWIPARRATRVDPMVALRSE